MHRKIYLILAIFLFLFPMVRVSDQSITVTANVDPSPSDYSWSIAAAPVQSTYSQNTTITYSINYGTTLTFARPLKITASWTQGTISGQGSPSVNVANYVVGSATNAYGNTPPVVDTVNQTITWNISSFPGNTSGQSVSFELKTTSNYTGASQVSWDTSTNLSTGTMTTSNQTVTLNYLYDNTQPTPTPVPTNNPSVPSSSPNNNPSIPPLPLVIDYATPQTITQNSATILISASQQIVAHLLYGTTPNNLNKKVDSFSLSRQTLMTMSDLSPDTQYYYKVEAQDSLGNQATSDIFTLTTAKGESTAQVEVPTFVAISNSIIVSKFDGKIHSIVLPVGTDFNFKFSLADNSKSKKVTAILRYSGVLSANNFSNNYENQIVLTEIQPGVFYGSFKTPPNPGKYEIVAQTVDSNNNLSEVTLARLNVVPNFSVYSKSKNSPIEGARVLIYYLNPKTNKYLILPPSSISILNPAFTDENGEINLVLAQGKYKALVSNIGYKDKSVEFELNEKDGYPRVYLEDKKITLPDITNYLQNGLNDVFVRSTLAYVLALTGSTRFFNVLSLLSLAILILLTLFSMILRIKVHPKLAKKRNVEERFLIALGRDILRVISMSFEILIILSLIFELLCINSFGLEKTAPFLAVSILNLLIWGLYFRIKIPKNS